MSTVLVVLEVRDGRLALTIPPLKTDTALKIRTK